MSTSQGRLAESAFIYECLKRSLKIYKPYCDNHGVDFIILSESGYNRVQVKSTSVADLRYPNKPSYRFSVKKGYNSRAYDGTECDYFALLIMPLNLWYIVPAEVIANKTTVRINPKGASCSFKKYLDKFNTL